MMLYEGLFREFQKRRVRYVLVGGLAANLLGSLRNTADMDILVEMTDRNLGKIVGILKKRGYRLKQPVDPLRIADEKTRRDWVRNKHMKALNFYKEDALKEVDIIVSSPVSYEDAKKDMTRVAIGGLRIPVISGKDLIRMKKGTGRPIDRIDVMALRRIEKIKRRNG